MNYLLGRTYPTDIENDISNLGGDLDLLMASSQAFDMAMDADVTSEIRDLNARLVNEVVIVSDEINDEIARDRLFAIRKAVFEVQGRFQAAGIPIQGYQPVPTVEDVATIPISQAKKLLDDLEAAFALYPSIVDRYARVRPLLSGLVEIPVAGALLSPAITQLDEKINEVDRGVAFAEEAIVSLGALIGEVTAAVNISRPTFVRIQNWIAAVNQLDEVLKRMEGRAEGKAATPARAIPWGWILAGGLAAVGLAFLLSD